MDKNSAPVFRFAPSPTGFLHLGGARTAIFNWLLSQKYSGTFYLRIEDTDQKRSTAAFTEQILRDLKWLGIEWDEPIVFQNERRKRHVEIVQQLLEEGKAYRCFCSPHRLQSKRSESEKQKTTFLYDQHCRHLSDSEVRRLLASDKPHVIRFKLNPGETKFKDRVRGKIVINHCELDDFVLLRSNGHPVYHLAVVVDDHDMMISDVIRGDDHLSNTPKQILIFQALGWKIPTYGHVPLIHGFDGARLSKRHGSTSVGDFRQKGILAEALFNYLCLLGWSPGDDRELMTVEEIIASFSSERINKKNAVFDEKKLRWINSKYLAQLTSQRISELLVPFLSDKEKEIQHSNSEKYLDLIELLKPRSQTVEDLYQASRFFFSDPVEYDEKGVQKYFQNDRSQSYLDTLYQKLSRTEHYQEQDLEGSIRSQAAEMGISAGDLIHPLRLALTGATASPGIFEVLAILGKQSSLRRIQNAIRYINNIIS